MTADTLKTFKVKGSNFNTSGNAQMSYLNWTNFPSLYVRFGRV